IQSLKSKLRFEWSPKLIRDPIELAGLPEGDILPHPRQRSHKKGGAQDKTAVSDFFRLWPHGVVPYQFSAEFRENGGGIIPPVAGKDTMQKKGSMTCRRQTSLSFSLGLNTHNSMREKL
ncbi:hypothetical protein SK128_018241, partial [Halocaridina rubra]